jgi:hypothetical protein
MNAILNGSYIDTPGFPTGSVVANIVATIIGTTVGKAQQTVAPGTTSITFPNVAADTYTFEVAAVDAAGNVFGTPSSGSFTVTVPTTVTLSLPTGFQATVA